MKKYQKGQAVLIVILAMTMILTIGLSVATRTITNIRTTAEEESSQRAFSAAEAGVERVLEENANKSGSFSNNTTYNATVTTLGGQEFLLNNGVTVLKDDATDLWLSNFPDYTSPWTGTLTLYWGSSGATCNTVEANNSVPALEVVYIAGTKSNPTLTHYALDPCSARAAGNKFEVISAGGGTVSGKTFAYKKTIPVISGLLMRIVPLYSSANIAVTGCNSSGVCTALPTQGRVITSVGKSDTTERKIVGFEENPKLPVQIFPYIMFSPK